MTSSYQKDLILRNNKFEEIQAFEDVFQIAMDNGCFDGHYSSCFTRSYGEVLGDPAVATFIGTAIGY